MVGGVLALCTGGVLVSCLQLRWCGPGVLWNALCLCHLGEMAEAIGSTDQGFPALGLLWLGS